jgi:hypothetical protein
MRSMSSMRSEPARWVAMANSPIGVSLTTKWFTWPIVPARACSGSRMRSLSSTPIRASPTTTQKSTTAGTTLLAREWKGFVGM